MTGRLKRLSSREILGVLKNFGFEVLVVPVQRAPRIGTVRAIYRQACRFIPEEDLSPHFFG